MENLPLVASPPAHAIAVNHFIQSALIPVSPGIWNVVRHINFMSESPDGKVKGELAKTYRQGVMYLVNYGTTVKNCRKYSST